MTPRQSELWKVWRTEILKGSRALRSGDDLVLSEILASKWNTEIGGTDRNELGKAFKEAMLGPDANGAFSHLVPIGVNKNGANVQQYRRR